MPQESREKYKQQAIGGRKVWLELKEKYLITNDKCLVFISSSNKELNHYAIKNLKEYIEKKYYTGALVVCEDELKEDEKQYVQDFDVVCIDENIVKDLLAYYRLVQFTKNIVVVSEKEPYGNLGIVGKKDITLEDYVKDAIYV